MALEMKVFKEIAAYEPKPMFGMTWRQLAALAVMVILGGGVFALVTFLMVSGGSDVQDGTSVAMWVVWPVILPAAFYGWWRPKGLMPEKFLSFAVREFLMQKEVVYGTPADARTVRSSDSGRSAGGGEQSVAGRGSRAEAKARRQQVEALRKTLSEH